MKDRPSCVLHRQRHENVYGTDGSPDEELGGMYNEVGIHD